MPKRDPRTVMPPPAVIRGDTFYEPRPEGAIDFTFRFRSQLDGSREAQMNERTSGWITDYVTGRLLPVQPPPPAPPVHGPPGRLPPVGEGESRKDIIITRDLCHVIAALMLMEYPEDGEEAYSFEDWAVMSVTAPIAFEGACEFAMALATESRDAEKNWPGPGTA